MKKFIYLFVASLVLTSCKTSKKATTAVTSTLSAEQVIDKYELNNNLNFKNIHINANTSYGILSIGLDIRILKDKIILINARIPIGGVIFKLYATPDEIQFYNKMEQEYFVGDYQLISNFLGMEMDFKKLQNLLLGRTLTPLNLKNSKFGINNHSYQFYNKSGNIITNYFLIPESYTLEKQTFENVSEEIAASISYKNYNLFSENLLPKTLVIYSKQVHQENTIEVNYKTITLDNPNLNFPFEIPNGYQPMSIKF